MEGVGLTSDVDVDPEIFPGSGSGILVPDPNPAKKESGDKK